MSGTIATLDRRLATQPTGSNFEVKFGPLSAVSIKHTAIVTWSAPAHLSKSTLTQKTTDSEDPPDCARKNGRRKTEDMIGVIDN